ncbi:hypothetical protein [Streptomyces fuscigenes]|uniref:hypothetical protein n=1 Tax=Streptomyces fuscigenes TaxID=1528880 RepID=UPI001F193081|nr:hypothetical protein [Streptomyces fuscigenes]MCF3964583.1 hypothetical protein [Streptomyces fuscigenes]
MPDRRGPATGTPDTPDTQDTQNAPDSRDTQNAPDSRDTQNAPDAPDAPDAQNTQNPPDAPGPQNTPDSRNAPEPPGAPHPPNAPRGAVGIRWELWLGAIPAIAGVLLPIAGLTLGRLLVFSLLAAAALPLSIAVVRPAWGWLRHALAAALTLVLVAFAVTVIYYQGHPRQAADAKPPHRVSQDEAASRLRFLPVTGPVAHCVSFSGTGRVPDGHALVIFDRPSDSGGRYTSTSTFSFDGEAAPSASGWTVPDLNLGSGDAGDKGTHMVVVAVLMPDNVAGFLDALNRDSETGAVPREVMELGSQADRLVVMRNGQNAHC